MFCRAKLELPSIKVPWDCEGYGDMYGQARVLHPRAHVERESYLPAFRKI